jgi:predicted PhzF superfamily epimerase YddE/YHI9
VLRVFVGPRGEGNPLGVVLDGREVPESRRQGIAAALGFSETVFVDDPAAGVVRIYTPTVELPFAGHPLVGTAWLLAREGEPLRRLLPPAGEVATRQDGDLSFVTGRPAWAPDYRWYELESPEAVEALDGPPEGHGMGGAWSWLDEGAGVVRARVFPRDIGVEEDEATGAAAVRLGAELGRELEIRQGRGSVILVRPLEGGRVEIGGRVRFDDMRPLP